MTRALLIAGTDTGIGKTVVAAALVALLDADYWKPIQAGLSGETDRETVMRLATIKAARNLPEAYRLNTPASPHRAAELDRISIDPARLVPPETMRPLVIEMAGGLLVPVTRELLQITLMKRWRQPTVLVASTRLGTINHTLLSIEALRRRGIAIPGVIFNGEANDDTMHTIADFAAIPVLGCLPHLDPLDAATLKAAARAHLDLAPLERILGSAS